MVTEKQEENVKKGFLPTFCVRARPHEDLQCTNLVVLEEEEGLHEGEDEMTDVDEDEDVGLTRGRVLCLKVGGNVEPIQGDAADTESWKSQRRQCMKRYITEFTMLF